MQKNIGRLLILFFTSTLLLLFIFKVNDLGLVSPRASDRIVLFAVPVCISEKYLGKKTDYTAYMEIRNIANHIRYTVHEKPFFDHSDTMVRDMLEAEITHPDGLDYWGYDDRGLAVFCKMSFTLFGPSISSFSKLWLLLFSLASICFVVGFVNKKESTALLWFAVNSAYGAVGLYMFMQTHTSIHHERAFDFLSFLPSLHIALFPFFAKPKNKVASTALILQILLFALLYHCRSSIGWQFIPIFFSAILFYAMKLSNSKSRTSKERSKLLVQGAFPIALTTLIFVVGYVYVQNAYHPFYTKGDGGTRTVYHNALMGLKSYDNKFGLDLDVDDTKIMSSVKEHIAKKRGIPVENIQYEAQFGREYETNAKELYFDIWKSDPVGMIEFYRLFRLPQSFLHVFSYASFSPSMKNKASVDGKVVNIEEAELTPDAKVVDVAYKPLNWISAILILAAIFYTKASFRTLLPVILILGVYCLAAAIPTTVFYIQGARNSMGLAFSFAVLGHLATYCILCGVVWVGKKIF